MSAEIVYPPFRDDELSSGFSYLRNHPRYAYLMPPKKTLKIDWFLLRAIANEIERRREPAVKLALLTGTVVREFIPDVNKETRQLGMAYRDAIMYMFRRRKELRRSQRATREKATEHPEDAPKVLRLI